ncbi:MAG TPA: TonB-dependent receptor [Lutibacter sp.]|nr:TonB-dependent receptor [Lutibacter sp.]
MKNYILYLFFFLMAVHIFAQKFTGKVIDAESSIEISAVYILNSDLETVSVSDEKGLFTLTKTGIYTFQKSGFYSEKMVIDNFNFHIVALQPLVENLNEIQIIGNNFQQKLNKIPASVIAISSADFTNNTVNIASAINKAPGIFMFSGTQTTNRITIRGIGSRNLYGTSKIKIYFDDIPLTNGSGESAIEDIELTALGRIEILKGPSSSIYGSGLGGAIQLIPNKGLFDQTNLKSGYTFGSFGLQKYVLQANLGSQANAANLVYANTKSDGFRENNKTDKQSFTLASNHFINDKNNLTFIASHIDVKSFIPSSIDENNYENNPESAASNWERAKGFEDYKKSLLGLSWKHNYSADVKHYTSIFSSFFDGDEARPFSILKDQTTAFGIRTKLELKDQLIGKSVQYIVGGELFNDIKKYKTLKNLYLEYPEGIGSVAGETLSDFKENRGYFNLFFDSNLQLSEKTQVNLGVNLNQTGFTLTDKFNSDAVNFSGKHQFKAILSPKIGVTHQLDKNKMVYGTISHGFSTPTLEETLLPNNTLNTNIKPEKGWNFEIGSRGLAFNNKLNYDVALYQMTVKNLLVAKRVGEDEYVGVNAGITSYAGLEITGNYFLVKTAKFKIKHNNNLSLNNFKFIEFTDFDNDYSGNKLTGIPNITLNSSVSIENNIGFYGKADFNYVGKMPMRDDNSVYSKKYHLVNGMIGFKTSEEKKISLDLFVGLNNIFDEKYAAMLLINATSFGTAKPRYYYPGEPVNYYAGINLKYHF